MLERLARRSTMRTKAALIGCLAATALLLATSLALARSKQQVDVSLAKDGRYAVDAYIMGGVELVGYFGELKETEGAVSAVLHVKGAASPEQQDAFAKLAGRAELKAYVDDDGELREIPPK
jgi:hypothetical protein